MLGLVVLPLAIGGRAGKSASPAAVARDTWAFMWGRGVSARVLSINKCVLVKREILGGKIIEAKMRKVGEYQKIQHFPVSWIIFRHFY